MTRRAIPEGDPQPQRPRDAAELRAAILYLACDAEQINRTAARALKIVCQILEEEAALAPATRPRPLVPH